MGSCTVSWANHRFGETVHRGFLGSVNSPRRNTRCPTEKMVGARPRQGAAHRARPWSDGERLHHNMNLAMRIERAQALGGESHQRTADRQGSADGFKPQTLRNAQGLTCAMISDGGSKPLAVDGAARQGQSVDEARGSGLRSRQAVRQAGDGPAARWALRRGLPRRPHRDALARRAPEAIQATVTPNAGDDTGQ